MQETETAPTAPPSPPIGIGHLLLWTACSAALLSLSRWLSTGESFQQPTLLWAFRAILLGPAIASLPLCLVRRRRGMKFPAQPGEWLLVLVGVNSLFNYTFEVLLTLAYYSISEGDLSLYLIQAGYLACIAVGCLLVSIFVRMPFRWRSVFMIVALGSLTFGGYVALIVLSWRNPYEPFAYAAWMPVFYVLYWLDEVLCLIVIPACCMANDYVEDIHRGWMHWVGTIIFALDMLIGLGLIFLA